MWLVFYLPKITETWPHHLLGFVGRIGHIDVFAEHHGMHIWTLCLGESGILWESARMQRKYHIFIFWKVSFGSWSRTLNRTGYDNFVRSSLPYDCLNSIPSVLGHVCCSNSTISVSLRPDGDTRNPRKILSFVPTICLHHLLVWLAVYRGYCRDHNST
jgi:hypothetical protein